MWHIFPHLTALHSPPPRVKRDGQLLRARLSIGGPECYLVFSMAMVVSHIALATLPLFT